MLIDCAQKIKRIIQFVVMLLNFTCFLIILFRVNSKDVNYIEYTSLSKSISNCYIIIVFLIMLIHSIFPKMMLFGIEDNLSILINDKGKIILIISIGILFWASNNEIHILFTVINFVTFFALLLYEFTFDCKILKKSERDYEKNTEHNNIEKNANIKNSGNNSISFI